MFERILLLYLFVGCQTHTLWFVQRFSWVRSLRSSNSDLARKITGFQPTTMGIWTKRNQISTNKRGFFYPPKLECWLPKVGFKQWNGILNNRNGMSRQTVEQQKSLFLPLLPWLHLLEMSFEGKGIWCWCRLKIKVIWRECNMKLTQRSLKYEVNANWRPSNWNLMYVKYMYLM